MDCIGQQSPYCTPFFALMPKNKGMSSPCLPPPHNYLYYYYFYLFIFPFSQSHCSSILQEREVKIAVVARTRMRLISVSLFTRRMDKVRQRCCFMKIYILSTTCPLSQSFPSSSPPDDLVELCITNYFLHDVYLF